MYCYECSQAGTRGEAIGICHHCSVALCQQHGSMITDPVTMSFRKARLSDCPSW
jgi:hypothetical protein